jgi:uncharacterized phage-associated protein
MKKIRFRFSAAKGRAALIWMLREYPGADLHTVLKTCYFADRAHLNKYGRPIFGATYRAMRFGPVPVEIYEMAKGEPIWLAELDATRYPWRLDGFQLFLEANSDPDLDVFSESDLEELNAAFTASRSMTFNERTSATHGPDWQAADLGFMRYEDMIDDSPKKAEIVEQLRETAQFVRL